jgi:hypothetical protein
MTFVRRKKDIKGEAVEEIRVYFLISVMTIFGYNVSSL